MKEKHENILGVLMLLSLEKQQCFSRDVSTGYGGLEADAERIYCECDDVEACWLLSLDL